MNILSQLIYALFYILPAYVANAAPVIFSGWGPLDRGLTIKGKRLFGDHKTIRGTIFGFVSGVTMGLIENILLNGFIYAALLTSLGAILGDLIGSFIKRRIGMRPGEQLIVMDQYGFLIFAFIFGLIDIAYIPSIYGVAFAFIITFIMHKLTNMLAYALKLKDVPW
ncbi:MAG: CDP-archaeol synthase [Candidatus Micrarchaeota archaeon]|nr:MAG: CDP-archaeol synthase [Candidatus Micrarchaeota archaeon]